MAFRRMGTAAAVLLLTVGTGLGPAQATPSAFRVGLIGDTGYSSQEDANLLAVRRSMAGSALAFAVHDGDIQKGGTPCSDARLQAVKDVFEGFSSPLVYTPGDNEWQDCPQPAGRLPAIRRFFFSTPRSLGRNPIGQQRQAGFPENARWQRAGVVFATLNVPGPGGGGPAAEADAGWLQATFDQAEANHAPAVMIIWQDDPTDGSSGRLVGILRHRAVVFRRPVVLVHGDTHVHKIDHPWADASNLTRVETYPGATPKWVRVTVDPARPGVFSYESVTSRS